MTATPSAASEFDLIRRHFARATPHAVLGPGDDCALLQPSPGMQLAITTDMLVAGTHFFADTDPRRLGWKTLAVNLSDLAAMGAVPRWVLLAGSLPEADNDWLAAFADGLFALAGQFGVDLVGGDTTRGPLNLCVTALGEVPVGQALRRDGALADDDLWVSGQPGLAALGLAHLCGEVALAEPLATRCLAALEQPQPRLALGLALRELGAQGLVHAAIDISDGLLADLRHILDRSQLAAEVHLAGLPPPPVGVDPALTRRCLLAGGDDYELLFTAAPAARPALTALAATLDLPLWRCGRLLGTAAAPQLSDNSPPSPPPAIADIAVLDEQGRRLAITTQGYDHFAEHQDPR